MLERTGLSSEVGLVVRTRAEGRRTVVSVAGELDLATVALVERAVMTWFPVSEEIALDMRGVTFIDSTGLRLLLMLDEVAIEDGRMLTLTPSGTVTRLLELTGLAPRFKRTAVASTQA